MDMKEGKIPKWKHSNCTLYRLCFGTEGEGGGGHYFVLIDLSTYSVTFFMDVCSKH